MDTDASIRILAASASPILRVGLIAILARQRGLCVAGEAQDGAEAVARCRQIRPDIVLLESGLFPVNGIDAARDIRRECPRTRVILLAFEDTDEAVYQAFRAGVKARLLKNSTPEELVETIRAVQAGENRIPPEINARMQESLRSTELSPRELDVLRALVAGKNNHEIGQALCIAEGTVKLHVSSLLEKLNVRDRTQAAVIALMRGIVRVP